MAAPTLAPEVDLWCPGATASRVQVTAEGELFHVEVAVTVRLHLVAGGGQVASDHALEAALHISMDQLGNWPLAEEAIKRPDGTRVALPKVDARMRVHRRQGAREPLQDLPLDVEALALDRNGALADAALRAQFVVAHGLDRLIAVVGIAMGKSGILWPSRDQVVADLALTGELYSTYPRQSAPSSGDSAITLDDSFVLHEDAPPPTEPAAPTPAMPVRPAGPAGTPRTPGPRLLIPPLPIPQMPVTQRPAEQEAQARRPATQPPPPPRRKRSEPPHPEPARSEPPPAPRRGNKRSAASEATRHPTPPTMPAVPQTRAQATSSQALEVASLEVTTVTAENEATPSQRRALLVDNNTPLAAWTVAWELRGKHSLTLVLKASCDIAPDGSARLRPHPDAPRGDGYYDDDPAATLVYPSDHALLKNRADVILTGRAHAPGGRAFRSEVMFRFGAAGSGLERRITVFGPREWRNDVPSSPLPFRSIPVIYERAFGGPAFARNPVGVGHGAPLRGSFVPSLEDPQQLLTHRGQDRRPMCFAPIAPSWEARSSKIGKSWRAHLEDGWSVLPDDFDWDHFQAAPRPQQLDHVTGDEVFEIFGMRPTNGTDPAASAWRGRLPGLAPQCHVRSRDGERPLRVSLDTVLIDAETGSLQLLWRGMVSVSSPLAPEIQALTVRL